MHVFLDVEPSLQRRTIGVIKKKIMNSSCEIEHFTLKFCRVCGFRARVWESYRTSRSFGYGYESVTELPEVPGIVAREYRTYSSSSGYGYECPTELTAVVPGTGNTRVNAHPLGGEFDLKWSI